MRCCAPPPCSIPVRVKLKIPRANAAAATTVDIPTGWDLQQRRPRPVADAGRSCWGSGQQDASAAQGTRGCWEPQLGALKRAHWALFCRLRAAVFLRFLVRVKTAATTVDIPGRWDPRANQSPTGALVAVLRTAALFDSRTGQIKNPPSECSGSYHGRHSYRMGLATTTTAASGRCREELLGQRPARRKCRPRHARMLGAATRGTKQQPTGLIAYPAAQGRAVRFPCGSN